MSTQRSQLLDWFRGLGIVAVIWGHAGLPGLPAAYLLIDCFFVISGYLVTQSFLRMFAKFDPSVSRSKRVWQVILAFYKNRFRRIVLPLAAAVLMTLSVGWFLLLPDDLLELTKSVQATLFLQAHEYGLSLGDYFANSSKQAPLLHAWSLSLEELFYILTPFLILPMLIWARWFGVFALIVFSSLSLWNAQIISTDPESYGASYYLFSTRAWEFVFGVILTQVPTSRWKISAVTNDATIGFGLLTMLLMVTFLSNKAPSPGLITVPMVLGMAAVLALQPRTMFLHRVTRLPGAAFMGLKLYSLYLAHYPLIVLFDYVDFNFGVATDLIKFALAILWGLMFYALFEAPLRGWRDIKFGKLLGISVALYATILSLVFFIQNQSGAEYRMPMDAQSEWSARLQINPLRSTCMAGEITQFGYSCLIGEGNRPYFALLGDSHSDAIAYNLAVKLDHLGYDLRHYWYAECPVVGAGLAKLSVFSSTCEKLNLEAHREILRDKDIAGVVYAMRWPWYLDAGNTENIRSYWRNEVGAPIGYNMIGEYRADFISIFEASLNALWTKGIPSYLVAPAPVFENDPIRHGVLSRWYRAAANPSVRTNSVSVPDYMSQRIQFDAMIATLNETRPVNLLELKDTLCTEQECNAYGRQGSLYYDNNHLNNLGSKLAVDSFFQN